MIKDIETTIEEIQKEKEEEVKTGGLSVKAKKGLIAITAIGVGCGLYGFKLGRRSGAARGFKDGVVYSQKQFYETAKQFAEVVKESKGE